jgi:hypothetical protein
MAAVLAGLFTRPQPDPFSKLMTLLRAARSFDAIAKALDEIVGLFSVDECLNFFRQQGYKPD